MRPNVHFKPDPEKPGYVWLLVEDRPPISMPACDINRIVGSAKVAELNAIQRLRIRQRQIGEDIAAGGEPRGWSG